MRARLESMFRRLVWIFRRRQKEQELQDEIAFHLEQEAGDLLASGRGAIDVRRSARQDLGNVTMVAESTRSAWGWTFLETFAQDLRYALRGLKNNPGFALTAILSLALGLGASLAIYTVADNLLLRPLPYPQPSRLLMLYEAHVRQHMLHGNVAPKNYFAWRSANTVFSHVAAYDIFHAVLGDNTRAEEITGIAGTADLLPILVTRPVLGRLFTGEEFHKGAASPVLISYRLWQSWYGGDPAIVGRQIPFGGHPATVAGVLPANFYFVDRAIDIWTPLLISEQENGGEGRWLRCVARLKADATIDQARAELSAMALRREVDDAEFSKGWGVNIEPLRESLVRNVKPSLMILLGSVGILLAVACANVANLLLARYTARQRELALRASLGAGRARVARQLFTESILLAAIGGTAGMFLAQWAVAFLVLLAPKDLTESIQISIDFRIYLFAAVLAAFTSILFGVVPALAGSRSELAQTMQTDGRSSIGGRGRLRAWLVGAEIALSVILLSGALLLFRSLESFEHVDPGIDADNVLTLRVSLPENYDKPAKPLHFFEEAVERIDALPGVRSASAISHLPFNGLPPSTFVVLAGRPPAKPGENLIATVRTVLPGYFKTLGIRLIAGRDFTAADNVEQSPHTFIVSEAFVRRYLTNNDPLREHLAVWMNENNPFGRIIGVVSDVRDETLDQAPTPTVYYPHSHLTYKRMILVVRAASSPLALADPIRHVIRSLDPAQPVADVRTMNDVIANTFSRQHFSTILLAGFSAAALLLAAIGIYGVLTFAVSERTREIGVRVAIGATPSRVVSLVLSAAAVPVIAGVLCGIACALALTGLLRGMLFNVSPRDPLTFAMVPAILTGVALFAAYVPARRASRLDPMSALRTQ